MILKPRLFRKLRKGHWAAKGLVGYWLFNEGSGNKVFDLSGNGNTGTFQGTAPSWTAGKFGSSVLLPGTDEYIDCGNGATVLTAAGAIVIWLKVTAFPVGDEVFISAYDGGNINFSRLRLQLDSNGRFDTYLDSPSDNVFMINDGQIVVDTWTQIVFTWDNAFGYIYQDAVLIGQDAKGAGGQTWYPLTIGANRDTGDPDTYFTGVIDHVLNYHRTLSASEIVELYLRPFAMFDRTPIELWVGATSVGAPAVGNPQYYYRHLLQGVA